jgi:Protein of unknown function (DUF4238)
VGEDELEAERADLTQPSGTRIVGSAGEHIETIRRQIEPTTALFIESGMRLWRFDRKALLTSDKPVSLMGEPSQRGGGIGLAAADFITIALSRFTALAICRTGGPDWEGPGTTRIAQAFNGAVSYEARKWVVSHPRR